MKKIIILLLLPIMTFAQKEVIIHITTDNYPSETKWTLYKDVYQGDTLAYVDYGHYDSSNTAHIDTVYIPDSITDISWVIWDSYGDGMPGGSYYVSICSDTIISYPVPTFTTGLIHNRVVPQCMPNPPPGVPATVIINLDQYQSETSWDIKDTNGTIYAQSVTYSGHPDYATIIVPVSIPKGDLVFTIYDSYGDGLNGALWQGQDGSYYLTQCNDTLIYGIDPAFGDDTSHVFVSDSCPPILGCTDIDYVEYNHFATVDDGSCQTLKVYGCIDTSMFNWDPNANTMDMIDSCDYTLVLHDLMGNGWVGSSLKIYADDTTEYYNTGGFNDIYSVSLRAPQLISMQFFISAQASLTTIECGFTLINPEGDTLISVQPPFIQPLFVYNAVTNCGNTCIEKIYGCTYPTAINYDSLANTDDVSCYYDPGCTSPQYLEYYTQGFTADYDDGTCSILAVWGCTDTTAFNYDTLANIDNGGCVPIILGCMQPLAFNYDPLANTSDTCIPYIYGCIDPTMYNYDSIANTDDGTCIPFVYGCTDSTMFNFNPLANAEYNPSNCEPYIYGCTDPSMLNYNSQANTEDFSCIAYIYGCTDSTALNYDSTANTDNNSCVDVVEGCMDQSAFNYDVFANVHDSTSCLFAASCITGPGSPYWLNDPCYAWVIEVDEYCCENEWDTICQATYNHCEGNWIGPLPKRITESKLIGITDLLGRPVNKIDNRLLFYIYDDGSVKRKIIINK
jgi:hypothetical protein